MQVQINDVQYYIGFHYDTKKAPCTCHGLTHAVREIRSVECYIKKCELGGDDKELVCQGRSVCHAGDTFSREKGRKLALTRALAHSNFNKAERSAIWAAYNNRKPSRFESWYDKNADRISSATSQEAVIELVSEAFEAGKC